MKTADAAKGRWPEILEHFGLPPITGKNHFKGECPVCGARGKFELMTATVQERGSVYVVVAMV